MGLTSSGERGAGPGIDEVATRGELDSSIGSGVRIRGGGGMLIIELEEAVDVRGAAEEDAAGIADVEAPLTACEGMGDFDRLSTAKGGLETTGDLDASRASSFSFGKAKLGGFGGSFFRTLRFIGLILSGLGASLSSFSNGGSGGLVGCFSFSFPLSAAAGLGAGAVVRPRAEFHDPSSCVLAASSGRGEDGEYVYSP